GKYFAYGGGSRVAIWDAVNLSLYLLTPNIYTPGPLFKNLHFSKDGKSIVWVPAYTIVVWDLESKTEELQHRTQKFDNEAFIFTNNNNKIIMTGAYMAVGKLGVFDFNSKSFSIIVDSFRFSRIININDDNTRIICGGWNNIALYNLDTNLLTIKDARNLLEKDTIYPNPTNNGIRISFIMPISGDTHLKLTDMNGINISNIFSGELPEGINHIDYDTSHLPAGIYFVQITQRNYNKTLKFVRE
ncbi:MAG: hypothetical protein QG635_63, partial [Bacteroidota bacterium]|nr:hypothetical protein [Bacteroidota bacterium]